MVVAFTIRPVVPMLLLFYNDNNRTTMEAEGMSGAVLFKHEDLILGLRTLGHIKKPGITVHTCNPGAERQEDHWGSLASQFSKLVNSKYGKRACLEKC